MYVDPDLSGKGAARRLEENKSKNGRTDIFPSRRLNLFFYRIYLWYKIIQV